MMMLSLTVNGEPRSVPAVPHARALLEHLALDPRAVVVELNRTIVRREALDRTPIRNGDRVELVHFVGGG